MNMNDKRGILFLGKDGQANHPQKQQGQAGSHQMGSFTEKLKTTIYIGNPAF
jgi:hypothetical protein